MPAPSSRAAGVVRRPPRTPGGQPKIPTPALSEDLLAAVERIQRSARRRAHRPVMLSSLTGTQLEVLRQVRLRPGVSVNDVAQALQLAPNTVSSLIGQLTEANVLRRRVDTDDRRVARLDVTPQAHAQLDAWVDRRGLAVGAAIDSLSPGDRHRLAAALPSLQRIADSLSAPGSER